MDRITFSKTINDLDDRLPKSRGDCFDFGSWYGCAFDCPQLQRGECEGDLLTILEDLEEDEREQLKEDGYYLKEFVELEKHING